MPENTGTSQKNTTKSQLQCSFKNMQNHVCSLSFLLKNVVSSLAEQINVWQTYGMI